MGKKFMGYDNASELITAIGTKIKAKYTKPSGGIPKSDLATAVQTSLGKADSAVQPETMSTALALKQDSLDNTQLAAVNSGINSTKVEQIGTNQTNIWYALNKVGKNLIPLENAILTNNGVNVTLENSVATVNGKSNSGTSAVILSIFTLPAGTYKLSGGSDAAAHDNTFFLRLGKAENDSYLAHSSSDTPVTEFTLSSETSVKLTLSLSATVGTVSGVKFYPMVCDKKIFDQDSTFQPYGAPNYDLTVREAEDRAALVEAIGNGVKNLLPKLKSYTDSRLSMVINDDNSITAKWSATGGSTLYARINDNNWTLPRGTYVLSGMPNDSNIGCYIHIETNTSQLVVEQERKTPVTFTIASEYEYLKIYISVRPNSAAETSGVTILPMIVTKAVSDIGANIYVPPALPNTDLTRMVNDLQKKAVKVYTYHVNPNESDPEDAVTYLDDATGLTPAKMGASSFSYGSWANAWFLPRPCMLKSDGTVAYYLNPNDYSKKTDGTASDIADANFDGNVMLEFPKIWVKRVAGSAPGERTVSIAPVNVDGTYKCWSNINAEDKEVDHFYLPAYNGTIHSSKMRSLSGVTLDTTYAPNYTRAQEVTAATANNPTGKNMWYTETWADFCLIYDLLYLMGKSLDVQRTFGQGLSSGSETAMRAYVTGTHNAKGLFYGDISGISTAVKVLGMENLWGCRWHGVAGLINDNGTLKVKMTYGVADGSTAVGYNTTGSGYLNYGSTYGTAGFVKKMQADNTMGYKIIETAGTDATYYCDYYYVNNDISAYAFLGGCSAVGARCGFYVYLDCGAAYADWSVGGSLSCRP